MADSVAVPFIAALPVYAIVTIVLSSVVVVLIITSGFIYR